MNALDAILIIEDMQDASVEQQVTAWQYLIDSGMAWRLNDWHAATAVTLIENGTCRDPRVEDDGR